MNIVGLRRFGLRHFAFNYTNWGEPYGLAASYVDRKWMMECDE